MNLLLGARVKLLRNVVTSEGVIAAGATGLLAQTTSSRHDETVFDILLDSPPIVVVTRESEVASQNQCPKTKDGIVEHLYVIGHRTCECGETTLPSRVRA